MGAWPCGKLQVVVFVSYSITCLAGSHSPEPAGFLFSPQYNVLWSPVRKYQPSAESVVAAQVLMSTRWDWTKSPACDEHAALTKLKGQRSELNTLNQGDAIRAVMHTRLTLSQKEVERADGNKLDKAVMVWKSLVRPSEVFFFFFFLLAPCGSAAAESALLPGGSGVPLFKAFQRKIYFLWLMQHPKYTHTTTLYFHHFILCQFIINTESTITMSAWYHPSFVTNKLHNSPFSCETISYIYLLKHNI